MITEATFRSELRELGINPVPLGRLVDDPPASYHVVLAGPGTGKTTALAVRALRLVFVDNMDPGAIIATTFTRRAAAELRSRILSLADRLRRSLIVKLSPDQRGILQRIDFNRIRTGTLDSLSEEILTDYRSAGVSPPIVIDQYLADALMLQRGLFPGGRWRNTQLRDYAIFINGSAFGLNSKKLATFVREIHERTLYDGVDLAAFRDSGLYPGIPIALDAIEDYREYMRNENLYDFAMLEDELLRRLTQGRLGRFQDEVRVLLVDEFQDTNYLQERIYFELARNMISTDGGITIVGDDDQALFRFRGATTNLFIDSPTRMQDELDVEPQLIYLMENRRSTDRIVAIVNDFINLDNEYVRIRAGEKPRIQRTRESFADYPILGMFRSDLNTLSRDLAQMIGGIVNGDGYQIPETGFRIERDPVNGSAADIILLASSPEEIGSGGKPRLPLLLRNDLDALSPPIKVYNPRGRSIASVPGVEQLLGLTLLCLDPRGQGPALIGNLPSDAVEAFASWRGAAQRLMNLNPPPIGRPSLAEFVSAWADQRPTSGSPLKEWPEKEIPFLGLLYKLVTWIPFFQADLEGLAYLEAINRTVASASNLGSFEASIAFRNTDDYEKSLAELYWNVYVPIALDFIEVDENLLDTLPRDRFGVYSIHQAKGLQFPLVIVDVGSIFSRNYASQAFKRFPTDGGRTGRLEDHLRRYSPLGAPERIALDRAFDDLVRQYFVAYSRAQDVLLLVGLNSMINNDPIPHVATGWDRGGRWRWSGFRDVTLI